VLPLIARRALATIPVMGVVALTVFALLHLTPGDPAVIIAGDYATTQDIARIRTSLGLDRPLLAQAGIWVASVARGDLGASIYSGLPVTTLIGQRVGPTVALTALAMLISVAVAVPQILRRPVETVGAVARVTPLAPAAAARPPMGLWAVKAAGGAGRPMQPQGEALGVASQRLVRAGARTSMRATGGTSMAPHNWSPWPAARVEQVGVRMWTSPLRTAVEAEVVVLELS